MEIFITRHGQTGWNVLGKMQGKTDIELNDVGRGQARETGELIKDKKIDLIITSPLKRAKETAESINENFDVEIIEDDRLMERGYGTFEGMTKEDRQELKEKYPEIKYIWSYNQNIKFQDVEPMREFCIRIYSLLDEVVEKYKDKNVLLVTHGGTSVPIKFYFMKLSLDKLDENNEIKGLNNCEVISFNI